MSGMQSFPGSAVFQTSLYDGEKRLGLRTVNFAIDWSIGNCQCVTLGASGLTITAPAVGVGFFQLKVTQDATGSRTLPTFSPAINWIGGTPVLPIAANSVELLQFYCDGTNFYGIPLSASNATELPTLIVGDPGTEAGGITVGGVTYQSVLKVSDIGGTNVAEMILHRHSTTIEALIVGSRSNSNTAAHAAVTAGQNALSLFGVGYTGADYEILGQIAIGVDLTGVISPTSSPGQMVFSVTPTGTVTPVAWLTVTNNGLATFTTDISITRTLLFGGNGRIDMRGTGGPADPSVAFDGRLPANISGVNVTGLQFISILPVTGGIGTATHIAASISARTPNTAEVFTTVSGIRIGNGAKGAAATITSYNGIEIQDGPIATQAAAINAIMSAGAGRWNFLASGTANNGVAGKFYFAQDNLTIQTSCGMFAGVGVPNNANGANGDIYHRSDGGALTTIYQRRAGAWVGIV